MTSAQTEILNGLFRLQKTGAALFKIVDTSQPGYFELQSGIWIQYRGQFFVVDFDFGEFSVVPMSLLGRWRMDEPNDVSRWLETQLNQELNPAASLFLKGTSYGIRPN